MGQYHMIVNLDKREYLHPHNLGAGVKLMEFANTQPGPATALCILLAAACKGGPRGGGDYRGPDPEGMVGRWAGDRIAIVGDYAEEDDLAPEHKAHKIYAACGGGLEKCEAEGIAPFRDISDAMVAIIEHDLELKLEGDGWKQWVDPNTRAYG